MRAPRERAEQITYRRKLRLRARKGRVIGDLEDNPHHFRVLLGHDDEHVTSVDGEAVRFPWSTCPGALVPLRELVGMALSPRCTAVGARTDPYRQCTHWFDLAGLCVAHAHASVHAGRAKRDYACAVWTDTAGSGLTLATLDREDEELLRWEIDGQVIVGPERFAGVHLHARFMSWAEKALDLELAEAALVLRRACFVAPSRRFDLDVVDRASELEFMLGRCHTFSQPTMQESLRMKGTFRDYTDCPEQMLSGEPRD